MLNKCREYLQRESILTLEIMLLSPLVVGMLVTGLGFFFGRVCSPWTLRMIWIVEVFAVAVISWRDGVRLLLALVILVIMTAHTFSFVGTDAMNYHFPMQDLLINGWNPVFDSSLERFDRVVNGLGLSRYHTLFLPKVNAICGAMVAMALNIYTGDSFLNYILVLCLFSVALRFARSQWRARTIEAVGFALICTCSTKMTSLLAGHADYVYYASLSIAIFSSVLWLKRQRVADLITLVASLTICMLSKTTGLVCGGLIVLVLLVRGGKSLILRNGILVLLALVIVIGASPLLTAWVQYGSPVYPTMTFDPTVSAIDITEDFTANADGNRMGYMARICYAWISQSLTERFCSLVYGIKDFHPEFYVSDGVGGLGGWFCALLILSFIALTMSARNSVALIVAFVFVTSNLAPLKYIGYNRYFPQMWLIPALSFFNLYFSPVNSNSTCVKRVLKGVTIGLVSLLICLSALVIARCVAYQCRSAVFESLRRELLKEMRDESGVWKIPSESTEGYSLVKRAEVAGIRNDSAEGAHVAQIASGKLLIAKAFDHKRIQETISKYPICNSPLALLRFPWVRGISELIRLEPLYR